jgi:hypothetical protein
MSGMYSRDELASIERDQIEDDRDEAAYLCIGDTVKWTTTDFSYVGCLLKLDGKAFLIQTEHGIMGSRVGDGTLEPSQASLGMPAVRLVEAVAKTAKPGSKLSQAIALVKQFAGLSRKEMIAKLVAEIGLTPAGASTYYSQAKKGA